MTAFENLIRTPPGIYPHGLGAKNVGPQTAENCWRVFAHPLNFRIGRHCQPYRIDVI